jgi:hypothetical protein
MMMDKRVSHYPGMEARIMSLQLFGVLADLEMDIYDLMEILGIIMRPIGALIFGLGAGWLAAKVFRRKEWQLSLGTILGLLAAFVLIGRWIDSPGTLGGYGLGVGIGVLLWGVGRMPDKDED